MTRPVDASLLAWVRISFGLVIAWECWRYVDLGRPVAYYSEPRLLFTYWPFDWVRPPPEWAVNWLFIVMGVLAVQVALGAFYRVSAWLLAGGLIYVFLLDRSHYLNHWYLMCLVAVLLAATPAASVWSLDARLGRRRRTVPGWTVDVIRFQLAVVYCFGGLAKLSSDWLAARPLERWISGRDDIPLIAPLLDEHWFLVALAVTSMLFDLTIPYWLSRERTRAVAYVVVLCFHLANSRLFTIGVFPWLMMLLTAVFFPPDFPRRMLADLRTGRYRWPTVGGAVAAGAASVWVPEAPSLVKIVIGAVAGAVAGYHLAARRRHDVIETMDGEFEAAPRRRLKRPVVVFLAGWVLVQLVVPLRHYVFPGDASWTEEGHMFAWRMMLRTKSGTVRFVVSNPSTGLTAEVDPSTLLSEPKVDLLAGEPDMLVQFAEWIEGRLAPELEAKDLEVRAITSVAFNGRAPAPLVDPNVDLTAVDRPWLPRADWILDRPDGD